ncbi:hypothetical protein NECAME_00368 [Necator americanus]|uniref:protein xylosyltransferase n=1 Tax=Necator americanus TaxID=51031 RepID=W2TBM3_NECAM|nr:hypothetical protein NECAME_00368 [Necator americanus]ETN78994.1 hypothetical protein NECAME_00368 [Necator americanus]
MFPVSQRPPWCRNRPAWRVCMRKRSTTALRTAAPAAIAPHRIPVLRTMYIVAATVLFFFLNLYFIYVYVQNNSKDDLVRSFEKSHLSPSKDDPRQTSSSTPGINFHSCEISDALALNALNRAKTESCQRKARGFLLSRSKGSVEDGRIQFCGGFNAVEIFRTGLKEVRAVAAKLPNVFVAPDAHSTIWGGASLLTMVQDAIRRSIAIPSLSDWNYLINLSESDFPVLTLKELETQLRL